MRRLWSRVLCCLGFRPCACWYTLAELKELITTRLAMDIPEDERKALRVIQIVAEVPERSER